MIEKYKYKVSSCLFNLPSMQDILLLKITFILSSRTRTYKTTTFLTGNKMKFISLASALTAVIAIVTAAPQGTTH